MVEVLPVLPADWRVLKEVRMRALEDAPEAFIYTLALARQRTDDEWRQFAVRWPAAHIAYAADHGGEPCGMIGGCFCAPLSHQHDKAAEMLAFWVAPEHRGRGVGRALVAAIAKWASLQGAQELHAQVAPANGGSTGFYKKLGFRLIEHPSPDENLLFLLPTDALRDSSRFRADSVPLR